VDPVCIDAEDGCGKVEKMEREGFAVLVHRYKLRRCAADGLCGGLQHEGLSGRGEKEDAGPRRRCRR
jgi:hypothetical protein